MGGLADAAVRVSLPWNVSAEDAQSAAKQPLGVAGTLRLGNGRTQLGPQPRHIAQIGRQRFEEILADLHYGTIAINAWTGLGFLSAHCRGFRAAPPSR